MNQKTTAGALLDALREPEAKVERPKMSSQARTELRKLMAVLKAEIAANAAVMMPAQKRQISELAKTLEAHLFML